MAPLNFPVYAFDVRTREEDSKRYIYDFVRHKYVRLTPEEWVRQHTVRYLVEAHDCPPGLIAVEKTFALNGLSKRADVVVYDRRGRPVLVAECKAPTIALQQETFDQAARYNMVLRAPHLLVTNGLEHFACHVDFAAQDYSFLEQLPLYGEMLERVG